jgi:hypothetical protein
MLYEMQVNFEGGPVPGGAREGGFGTPCGRTKGSRLPAGGVNVGSGAVAKVYADYTFGNNYLKG